MLCEDLERMLECVAVGTLARVTTRSAVRRIADTTVIFIDTLVHHTNLFAVLLNVRHTFWCIVRPVGAVYLRRFAIVFG